MSQCPIGHEMEWKLDRCSDAIFHSSVAMPNWARDGTKAFGHWFLSACIKLLRCSIGARRNERGASVAIASINATIDSSRRDERGRGLQNICIVKNNKAKLISYLALRLILERMFFVMVRNPTSPTSENHLILPSLYFFTKDLLITTRLGSTLLMSVRCLSSWA